jgi:hypothetical protein
MMRWVVWWIAIGVPLRAADGSLEDGGGEGRCVVLKVLSPLSGKIRDGEVEV